MRKSVLFLGAVMLALTTVASAAVVEITTDTTSSWYGYGVLKDGSEGLGLLKQASWYKATGGEDRAVTGTFSDGEFIVGTGADGLGEFTKARVGGMYGTCDGTLTVSNATFNNNSVTSARSNTTANSGNILGGLLYGGKGLTLDNVKFNGNSATATGANGLILGSVAGGYMGQSVILKDVEVKNTTAAGARVQGGAIATMSGSDTVATRYTSVLGTTTFSGNSATGSLDETQYESKMLLRAVEGGALHSETNLYLGGKKSDADSGSATITFSNNTATASASQEAAGGAVFANRNTYVVTDGNSFEFTGNKAIANSGKAFGGALYAGRCTTDAGTTSYEINFGGSNNSFVFENNEATSTSGNGFGGAIAAEAMTNQDGTKTVPVSVTLGGSNNTYAFTGNTAKTHGGAIYCNDDVNISGKTVVFENNTAGSWGGAIYSAGDTVFSGDNASYTFTGNSAVWGGALCADGSVSFSGSNVTARFVENQSTSNNPGADIYAEGSISATGSGSYTFSDGVWASNGKVSFKGTDDVITLTTGSTSKANMTMDGSSQPHYVFGVLGSWDQFELSNVTLQQSRVNLAGVADAYKSVMGGVAYGNFGVKLDNVTVSNNSATANISVEGLLKAGTGNSDSWSAIVAHTAKSNDRFSAIAGTSTFENNTATSAQSDVSGSVIASTPFLFLGAKADENGLYVDAGNSKITFTGNKAVSTTGNIDGGVIETLRGVVMQSSGNTVVFENNQANAAGKVYGGAIAAQSNYKSVGESGVFFDGDNNRVKFTENIANGAEAYGGAIAAFKTAGMPDAYVRLGGNNSSYNFTGNTATTYGGAIYAEGDVSFAGDGTKATFSGNEAQEGGDIYATGAVNFSGKGQYTFNDGIYAGAASTISGASVLWSGATNYDFMEGLTVADKGSLIINANGMRSKSGLNLNIQSGIVVLNQSASAIGFDYLKAVTTGDEDPAFTLGNVNIGGAGTLDLMNANKTGAIEGDLTSESGALLKLNGAGYTAGDLNLAEGTKFVLNIDELGEDEELVLISADGVNASYANSDITFVSNGNQFKANADNILSEDGRGLVLNMTNLRNSEGYQTAVPEPSTWLLMVLGVFGMGYVSRRRKAA